MQPYLLGLTATSIKSVCVLCAINPIFDGFLCQACDESFDWQTKTFSLNNDHDTLQVFFASFYEGITKNALSQFKDHENLQTLPFLYHSLYRLSQSLELPDDTLILPVPTTKGRLSERGFYPVGVLAKYLSALTGFAIYTGVSRPAESQKQRGLDRSQRLTNLTHAFVMDYPPDSRSILIFDDVATTGATFRAVAQAFFGMDVALTAACIAHGRADFYKNTQNHSQNVALV